MFASLGKALANFFDGTLKGVVLRSAVLTLALFVALFLAAEFGLAHLPTLGWPWVNTMLEWVAPLIVLLLIAFLGAPVAALFASLFLGEVAAKIETRAYQTAQSARDRPGAGLFAAGMRLAFVVLVVNLALLPLDVELPGVGEAMTVIANAWLLGREYFELAALRHLTRAAAEALRRRHGGSVFAAGLVISLLTMIPVVNLLVPLFATALMVHLFQRYAMEERLS